MTRILIFPSKKKYRPIINNIFQFHEITLCYKLNQVRIGLTFILTFILYDYKD